jgi:hypothetical protein
MPTLRSKEHFILKIFSILRSRMSFLFSVYENARKAPGLDAVQHIPIVIVVFFFLFFAAKAA